MKISINFSRIALCLFASAVLLFLVNLLLILAVKYTDNLYSEYKEFHDFKINQDSHSSILHLPTDVSGSYYIHRNFIRSRKIPDSKDIVLASHCTGNHLHHLITLSHNWNGPVSVAIFVPGDTLDSTLSTLYIMYRCFINIHDQVSVHLVYPASDLPENHDIMSNIQKAEQSSSKTVCANAFSQARSKWKYFDQNYAAKTEYPNNLLRNIARRSTDTHYSLVIDIDMTPNKKLYHDFITFAERNKLFEGGNSFYDDSSVFVLPSFEADINKAENLPQDKAHLVQLVETSQARPFYYDICWKCQKPTDYDRWKNLGSVGDVDVAYEVKWKDPWEPFFIAPRTSPDYDERFKQYGFNRISQACELHVAGFNFFVLDQVFLVHQGFKNRDSFHKSKDQENEKNRILFRTFKEELKSKYPHSTRRCY